MPTSKKRPKAAERKRAQAQRRAEAREQHGQGMRMAGVLVQRRVMTLGWIGGLMSLGAPETNDYVSAVNVADMTPALVLERLEFAARNGSLPAMYSETLDEAVALITVYYPALRLVDEASLALRSLNENAAFVALAETPPLPVPPWASSEEQFGSNRWTGALALSSAMIANVQVLCEQGVTVTRMLDRIHAVAVADGRGEDFAYDAALLVGATATDLAISERWSAAKVDRLRANRFGLDAASDRYSLIPLGTSGNGLLALTNDSVVEGLVEHGLTRVEAVARAVVALDVLTNMGEKIDKDPVLDIV